MVASVVGEISPSTLASSLVVIDPRLSERGPPARADRRTGLRRGLGVLDDRRHPLADPDAQRGDAVAGAAPTHLPDQRGEETGTGAPERMSERDRATVYVQPLLVDTQLSGACQDLSGERLVDLDQVDVLERHPGVL